MIKKTTNYEKSNPLSSNQLAQSNSSTVKPGFTIVELLVVIVVIGILAAISVVSYSGMTNRAKIVSLQSDLSNAAGDLELFNLNNKHFPTSISTDCTTNPTTTTNLCLKASSGNDYTSTPYLRPTAQSYILTATNGDLIYHITEKSSPTVGVYVAPSLAVTDPANWLQVGTQVWAKYNLNVGTRIAGSSNQTNNGGTNVVEKYCYGDTDAGCTNTDANGMPYGALYQWDEAMKYVTTENAQGICPSGSHIPSDAEWQTLEVQLGMDAEIANATGWRGTDQGTKLKFGGASGLNIPLAGLRSNGGNFSTLSSNANLWSSSGSSTSAWFRGLNSGNATVFRTTNSKAYGFSVRCIGN